jgi:hypothetical protein
VWHLWILLLGMSRLMPRAHYWVRFGVMLSVSLVLTTSGL